MKFFFQVFVSLQSGVVEGGAGVVFWCHAGCQQDCVFEKANY